MSYNLTILNEDNSKEYHYNIQRHTVLALLNDVWDYRLCWTNGKALTDSEMDEFMGY